MDNILEEIETKAQDGNDLISVFLGGKLEGSGYDERYRFPEGVCPPFNVIPRWAFAQRCMRYHTCYDWLMVVIKKCWENKDQSHELNEKYTEIINHLTDFNFILPHQMTHERVVEFIEIYNKINEKKDI